MKWLISGGRDFGEIRFVYDKLDGIASEHGLPSILIHGGALGADSIAGRWAQVNQIPVQVVKADWDKEGPAAGPRRNSRMLEFNPDLCIFFPGNRGTADMLRKARAAGHTCIVFTKDNFI